MEKETGLVKDQPSVVKEKNVHWRDLFYTKELYKGAIGEFMGVFILVLIGTGSICNGYDAPVIAAAFGITITSLVFALETASGAHLNPAVSVTLAVFGRAPIVQCLLYVVAQLLGSVVASAFLYGVFPEAASQKPYWLGVTDISPNINAGQGVVLEAFGTAWLLFIIFSLAVQRKGSYSVIFLPIAIGLTVLCLILLMAPLTGAGFNPARSFGPAIVSSHWDNHWIYWLGPLVGAAGGAAGALILVPPLTSSVAAREGFRGILSSESTSLLTDERP